MKATKKILLVVVAGLLLCDRSLFAANRGGSILEQIGVTRGICVVLGDTEGELAVELARDSELLIYVQSPRAKEVETVRKAADDTGLYGTRIFVEKGAFASLNLADNVADAVVVTGRQKRFSQAEIRRVLRPRGKALLGRKLLANPTAAGVDNWSHPYHGPDNNPQSDDTVIKAPYLTQFLAEPRYAPVPQVAVASAGRLFKAFGHVAFKKREEPFLNKLVAFNGYNGTILWQRDLIEGVMIHRNTMIAMPSVLYVGDDRSCKVIDAATGELLDEIRPTTGVAGGTFWKWMAMENCVLYALIGRQEQRDPTMRWEREAHGWPWNPISRGFNQPDRIKDPNEAYAAHPWGFGCNVLAINPRTKKVLWSHREDEPVDGRAICMGNGRIYIFRFGSYLACLDATCGDFLWRRTPDNAPDLFEALGDYSNRQGASWNWRTTCYLKCSDDALYFAGPQVGKLLAVSTRDGRVLWSDPYNNFQLIIRENELYAIAGQNDLNSPSKKFDPLTGEVLAQFDTGRRACTRPTGTSDSIFYRARGGSTRFDLAASSPQLISPMRPPCHDGVTIANGLLYWSPSVCDCQLTLYGFTSLAPAGDFHFRPDATGAKRLERSKRSNKPIPSQPESSADWPTFRADNTCSATTEAVVPQSTKLLWEFEPGTRISPSSPPPTPPVAAGGLVFTGGPDGIVRAVDAASGRLRWKAYTGGAIRMPPTVWAGRVFVGSGDGWVYSFKAKNGWLIWRFRAAPAERKIPVYGAISSTWPAGGGVLVEDGVAYVAAGIVNYDGTYVYALDAVTGKVKWQNDTSGHLNPQARSGVSLQGHMLLTDGRLYIAGGNAVSPAVYDTRDGKCLNEPDLVQRVTQNNVLLTQAPRGWELSLLAGRVVACGRPFYAHPDYEVYDATVFSRVFLTPERDGRDIAWVSNQKNRRILCFDGLDRQTLSRSMAKPANQFLVDWVRLGVRDKPLWSRDCAASVAIAVCANAVVIAEESKIVAVSVDDGSVMWSHPLPAAPVEWGLAIDRKGRAIVTLKDGGILCFGKADKSKEIARSVASPAD
jgi:outer membrane protein assembly factor BamB